MHTLARGLDKPSGVVAVDGRLLVIESAAHRIVVVASVPDTISGAAMRAERPPSSLRVGCVMLRIPFTPAPGRKLDTRYGPSTSLSVTASPPELLVRGAGDSTDLDRLLGFVPGTGVLHVTAQAASCDDDAGEHPACYLARQDWSVPIRIGTDGDTELVLPLLD